MLKPIRYKLDLLGGSRAQVRNIAFGSEQIAIREFDDNDDGEFNDDDDDDDDTIATFCWTS